MTDTKSNTPQVTHYADDATLAHIAELERQLAEARRLLVEASKDAERYRYFKGHLHQPHAIAHFVKFNNWHPSDADYLKDLDAAIDNAMDAGRGK
jgi:hypothetical protein